MHPIIRITRVRCQSYLHAVLCEHHNEPVFVINTAKHELIKAYRLKLFVEKGLAISPGSL